MDIYIIIDIDKGGHLNYWSNSEGWTYYRELATEWSIYQDVPSMPIGNNVMLVKSEPWTGID